MKEYIALTLDEERALYGISDAIVRDCVFAGPADGESALKETRNVKINGCKFDLRYPMWHLTDGEISSCRLSESCRAALWYDKNITLRECVLEGTKALRECDGTVVDSCEIESSEFGWMCRGVKIVDSKLKSEYPFLKSSDMEFDGFTLKGKYSFQYAENVVIRNSNLDTKDAFWHGKNITVIDSVVRGEYLAWYSENLRLVRCKIIGTQPLCYAKGLVLEDCEMVDADFAFENSELHATVIGSIISVKNPRSGKIKADSIGEIILDQPSTCEIG